MNFEFWQKKVTQTFFWTSPIAVTLLLMSNFPAAEKVIWELPLIAPVFSLVFVFWLMSMICVVVLTIFGSQFREHVLHDYVLQKDRDEREAIIAGEAAKKAILITMVVCAITLIATTGRLNLFDNNARSSLTIGHFQLADSSAKEVISGDLKGTQYDLPMSKTSIVLLIMLIQLTAYHGIKVLALKKAE